MMTTTSNGSSGPVGSSPNPPSLRNDQTLKAQSLIVRVVIAHTALLALAPLLQSATDVRGGWTDGTLLVILFIAGPLVGLVLRRSGQERIGSVLLLAFLSAATYMHVEMMLSFTGGQTAADAVTAAAIGLQVLLVCLILCSLFGSLLSFALLRHIHAAPAASEKDRSS